MKVRRKYIQDINKLETKRTPILLKINKNN